MFFWNRIASFLFLISRGLLLVRWPIFSHASFHPCIHLLVYIVTKIVSPNVSLIALSQVVIFYVVAVGTTCETRTAAIVRTRHACSHIKKVKDRFLSHDLKKSLAFILGIGRVNPTQISQKRLEKKFGRSILILGNENYSNSQNCETVGGHFLAKKFLIYVFSWTRLDEHSRNYADSWFILHRQTT